MLKKALILSLAVTGGSLGLQAKLFAMGRIPKEQYDAKVAELEGLKKQCAFDQASRTEELINLQSKYTELESKNTQILTDFQSSKDESQKKLAQLMLEKEAVEKEKAAEVDRLKSTYDNLVGDMKKEIDAGSIQITQLQDKLSVSLVDKIVFNSGESELNEQGKQVLKRVADILKKVKGKQIRIEGHTDNVPIGGALKEKFPSNWELSAARATTVARYLQDSGNIDPQLLTAAGYGQYRPVADNSTPEGRLKNRRIEIALIPLEVAAATPASPVPAAPQKAPAKTPAKSGQ